MDGLLTWNLSKLANALQVKVSEARTYFRDGRKLSFLAEVVLAKELGMDKAETESKPYDLIDPNTNEKWEVRCMNRTISFAPSNMTGANRLLIGFGWAAVVLVGARGALGVATVHEH